MFINLDFLTNEYMIGIYVVLISLLILFILIKIYDKTELKRKKRLNTKELNKLVEQIEEKEKTLKVENKQEEKEKENIVFIDLDKEEDKIEELTYNEATLNKTEAIEELEKLTQELEREEMLQRTQDLSKTLTKLELEEERTAIISIDEYLERTNKLNLMEVNNDEDDAPITLDSFEKVIKESLDKTEDPVQEILDDEPVITKYRPTPVISPIYGINNNNLELENTFNYDKFDRNTSKANEFVVSMKDLQENNIS